MVVVIYLILDLALIIFSSFPFEDLNLKSGVTIPAGAGLVVPVQLVQMDDCSWGSDANEFNPYRFLSKPGKGSDIMLNKSVSGFIPTYFQFQLCLYSFQVPYSPFFLKMCSAVIAVLTNHKLLVITVPFSISLQMLQ